MGERLVGKTNSFKCTCNVNKCPTPYFDFRIVEYTSRNIAQLIYSLNLRHALITLCRSPAVQEKVVSLRPVNKGLSHPYTLDPICLQYKTVLNTVHINFSGGV